MKEVLYVFGALMDADIDALMRQGTREELPDGSALIVEGRHPGAVFLVLDGDLCVTVDGVEEPIGHVGGGEIVGEMSLLEARAASATLRATNGSVSVLRIPEAPLRRLLDGDPALAARFNRALAMLLSHRLRERNVPAAVEPPPLDRLLPWAPTGSTDLAELFEIACREHADRPAYEVDGAWISYAECRDRVARIAASLHERLDGVRRATGQQPTLAVLLPNSHVAMELFYVAAAAGAIVLPINHRLSASEIESGLRASGVSVLVTSDTFAETLRALRWSDLPVRTLVWTSPPVAVPVDDQCSWDSLLAVDPGTDPHVDPAAGTRPASFVQGFGTSGTTGRSKTVLHSHHNVVSHSFATIRALGLSADERHCWGHFGPMFHVGDAAFVWIAMLIGARHVFHGNQLRYDEVGELLASERVTIVKLVPSMLQLMCDSDRLKGMTFPALRWVLTGGAAPDPALVHRVATLFDCDVIQGFGMTEATCHVAFKVETQEPMKRGLRVLPGLDVRVVDDEDQPEATGRVGEIVLKGDTVFSGYLTDGRLDTGTSAVFTADGYFRSGDLGSLDDAGHVHVVGRRKDMIDVGGENVFAWEVEQVVEGIAGIRESAAFAVPHGVLGEVVEIAVVRDGARPDGAKVKARCRALLAGFKVPRRVHFVDELPRTQTGKVQKQLLSERLADAQEQPDEPVAAAVSATADPPASDAVAALVRAHLATVTSQHVDDERQLFDVGLDSLGTLELIEQLEERFATTVPPTLLYDHPTIRELGAYFDGLAPAQAPPGPISSPLPDATRDKPPGTEPRTEPQPAPQPAPQPEPRTEPRTEPEDLPQSPSETRSATSASALVLQLLSLLVRPALLTVAFVPAVVTFELAARRLSAVELLLLGPVWLAATLLVSMAAALLLVRFAGIGRSSRDADLWTPAYFRWLLARQTLRAVEAQLGILRGTGALTAFYRLGGARIGRNVRVESVAFHDLTEITIDNGTVIGRDVTVLPGRPRGDRLVVEPVQIGRGCTIGAFSTLLGGAVVEAGASVRPLAAVDGRVAAGGPAAPSARQAPGVAAQVAAFVLVGYLVSLAAAVGILFVIAAVDALGQPMPSVADLLLGRSTAPAALSFFAAVALALRIVIPAVFFALVVVVKHTLPRDASWSRWVYARLVDVPFFAMFLRLNVMSHPMRWWFRLLGARVGVRPLLAAPYTAEPDLLEVGDRAMVAGNVAVYALDHVDGEVNGASGAERARAGVRIGDDAVVTNSCILLRGADVSSGSLLGDLSVAGGGDAIPAGSVAVGSPPRVVGRASMRPDRVGAAQYVRNQSALVLLQWLVVGGVDVAGFVLMGAVANGLVDAVPTAALWVLLPALLLVPRLVKVVCMPLLKWVVLGRVRAGEHPAYGWAYTRWLLMETVVMDTEPAFLTHLQGTWFLSVLWRSMGARVGRGTCLLASSLGSEYDLKSVGDRVILEHQSQLFGHSIEHHSLRYGSTLVRSGAHVGPFAIVEAGASVLEGQVVRAHRPVHAQRSVGREGAPTSTPDQVLNLHDIEKAAQALLPTPVFDYFAGGAEDGQALARNRASYGWVHVRPRVLVDVATISTKTRLLGRALSSPILIAPTAMQRLVHPDGELATARAAARLGYGMVLSFLSTTSMEDVAKVFSGSRAPLLLQLYMLRDDSLMTTIVDRAHAAGFHGLVVTVDAPVSGRREADIRNGFALGCQVHLPHLDGVGMATRSPLLRFETMKDATVTWERLARLRQQTDLPIWLKGVLRADDILHAAEEGYDGVVLSNHGGRQLDVATAPLEALPAARHALDTAGHRTALLVDGGVRRGSDVLKALGLGADAVMIGRPAVWGLAVNGQGGVAQVLNLLEEELATTMRLAGCARLEHITPDLLTQDIGVPHLLDASAS